MLRFTICLTVVLFVTELLPAEPLTVRVRSREELANALRRAKPGTTILLEPGTYRGGLSQSGLRGTDREPIVIAAADADRPPVIEGGGGGLHLAGPEHIHLRNLVLRGAEGNGLNIDHGGRDVPARHITLSGLIVRDVGPRGNCDGIKLSGIDDFRVENCRVERWGDGGSAIDMVGCHKGVITGCTFRHEQADGANGVQAKGGSSEIILQRCHFENAGGRAVNIGGSTGLPFFRPESAAYEAKDITVEDCTFVGSTPIAFVGVDGAVVRHNSIYRPTRWIVRILQESQGARFVPCRNGTFEKNLIVFRSEEMRTVVNIGGGTAPETFTFSGNLWYCVDRPAATRNLVRLPVREPGGVYDVDPELADPEKGDFRARSSRAKNIGVRTQAPAGP